MNAHDQVNTPGALSWVVALVFLGIAVFYLMVLAYEQAYKVRQRRHDTRIFKAAEEARNDFS